MRALLVLAMAAAAGCQAVTDPGVDYVECFPAADGKYVELFDRNEDRPGADSCWKTDNVMAPAYVRADGEDLLIHPSGDRGAGWPETAPFFYQRMAGDFFIMTRAEAVSTKPGKDHCLNPGEAAGLVVRRREPFAWTTLLVRPDLSEERLKQAEFCGDELDVPALAQVSAESYGFGSDSFSSVGGKGEDGEAYIALCRVDHQLFFFNQARVPVQMLQGDLEESFAPLDVGGGPLDVGLTATAEPGTDTLPEGHFTWLVLEDYSGSPGDGCNVALENFKHPEPP